MRSCGRQARPRQAVWRAQLVPPAAFFVSEVGIPRAHARVNFVKDEVLLDEAALRARGITYSRWHKNRLEREGKFPKRILCGNRIFWLKSEIDAWLAERIAERDRVDS